MHAAARVVLTGLLGAAIALAWTAAAAGPAVASPASATAIVDDRGRRIELPRPPVRIVTLAPALTETVCALGACARLVGTDRHSNWPESVRALPKLGVLEEAQVERIATLRPDLVLATASVRAVTRLEQLGLKVVQLEPRTLEDTRRVLEQVALLLGEPAAAGAAWQAVQSRIEEAAARVPLGWRGQRAYLEVASTPYAAGEASFAGELLARLGLRNIVPAALGPFPQLSPEFVLREQPELIVATREALAGMPARPGWPALRALRAGRTCGLEPAAWDALVRPGPRLGEAALALAECLQRLGPRAGLASGSPGASAELLGSAPAVAAVSASRSP